MPLCRLSSSCDDLLFSAVQYQEKKWKFRFDQNIWKYATVDFYLQTLHIQGIHRLITRDPRDPSLLDESGQAEENKMKRFCPCNDATRQFGMRLACTRLARMCIQSISYEKNKI